MGYLIMLVSAVTSAVISYLILKFPLSMMGRHKTKIEAPKLIAPPAQKPQPQEKTVVEDGITYIIRDGFWFRQFVFDYMTLELCVKHEEPKANAKPAKTPQGIIIEVGTPRNGIGFNDEFYPVDNISMNQKVETLDRYAERTEDGVLHRELIGVYFNYTMRLRWADPLNPDCNKLFDILSNPIPFQHVCIVTRDGGTLYNAYISSFETQDCSLGKILTIKFLASEPQPVDTVEECYIHEDSRVCLAGDPFSASSMNELERRITECCCNANVR